MCHVPFQTQRNEMNSNVSVSVVRSVMSIVIRRKVNYNETEWVRLKFIRDGTVRLIMISFVIEIY